MYVVERCSVCNCIACYSGSGITSGGGLKLGCKPLTCLGLLFFVMDGLEFFECYTVKVFLLCFCWWSVPW
jgi:hypothetical protein